MFEWDHYDIKKISVRLTLADKILTSFMGLFGGRRDPDPKSCSIQKQNSGMINTPLN